VAVFVGQRAVALGRLDPGATRSWRVATAAADAGSDVVAPESTWLPSTGAPTDAAGSADLAVWRLATLQLGPDLRAPGAVVAAGWHVAPGPVGAGAGPVAELARVPVHPAGPGLARWAARRQLLRAPPLDPSGTTADATALLRFALPGGTVPPGLALVVPPSVAGVDVWVGDRAAALPLEASRGGRSRTVAVPDGAVADGVLLVTAHLEAGSSGAVAAGLLLEAP